jgi:hypothetical protein
MMAGGEFSGKGGGLLMSEREYSRNFESAVSLRWLRWLRLMGWLRWVGENSNFEIRMTK